MLCASIRWISETSSFDYEVNPFSAAVDRGALHTFVCRVDRRN